MFDMTQSAFQLLGRVSMIKAVYAFAAVGMTVAPISASVAAPVQDVIQTLMDKADELFGDKGFKATGWQQRGELKQGGEVTFQISLKAGTNALVGMCDTDCSNLDMYITDSSGAAVDQDVEDDDFPIVMLTQTGNFNVRLVMKSCSSSPCAYGVRGYKQ
jgi:hypothetical protein